MNKIDLINKIRRKVDSIMDQILSNNYNDNNRIELLKLVNQLEEKDDSQIRVCEDCGSENIQILTWINQSTGEVGLESENDFSNWCTKCKKHVYLSSKEEYLNAKMEYDSII
jgi:hypothetical protein